MQKEAFISQVERLGKNFGVRGVLLDDKIELLWEEFGVIDEKAWVKSCKFLLENNDRFPKIKEFKGALQSFFASTPIEAVKIDCDKCDGSGFIMATKDCSKFGEITMWNDYAFRCSCKNAALISMGIPKWETRMEEKGFILKADVTDKEFENDDSLKEYAKELMTKKKDLFKEAEKIFA